MSDGFSFIHFSSNTKGTDLKLKIFNSEVNGNCQWSEYFSSFINFDSLHGDKNAEFINSSFNGVSVEGKRSSNLHIEGYFLKQCSYLYPNQKVPLH